MSVEILISDDGRDAVVNGKNVYQDVNDNWVASGEPLSELEKRNFWMHIQKVQGVEIKSHTPFAFCKVKEVIRKSL